MSRPARSARWRPDELAYRPVTPAELPACAQIWRDSINDYTRRLAQPDVPDETGPLVRLYEHLQSTDPDGFVVAEAQDPDADVGRRIVGFAAALRRERLWFLSMLFVEPGLQSAGVGRALLAQVLPAGPDDGVARATATDSAQPISNALYAWYGIVPRVPLFNLIGLPTRPEAFGALPSGVTPVRFDDLASDASDGSDASGHGRLVDVVDALDREVLGVAHPVDHRFLRAEGRRGWLYVGPDGLPLAYGYAGDSGRLGPAAARDETLLAPILGHLTRATEPRGAYAVWLPGTADHALTASLHAGLRLEPFPDPGVLGPPVRRPRTLPAHLTRTALDPPAPYQGPGVA